MPVAGRGPFAAWCRRHGYPEMSQEAVDKAVKRGGRGAKLAAKVVTQSAGKLVLPAPPKEVKGVGRAEAGVARRMKRMGL